LFNQRPCNRLRAQRGRMHAIVRIANFPNWRRCSRERLIQTICNVVAQRNAVRRAVRAQPTVDTIPVGDLRCSRRARRWRCGHCNRRNSCGNQCIIDACEIASCRRYDVRVGYGVVYTTHHDAVSISSCVGRHRRDNICLQPSQHLRRDVAAYSGIHSSISTESAQCLRPRPISAIDMPRVCWPTAQRDAVAEQRKNRQYIVWIRRIQRSTRRADDWRNPCARVQYASHRATAISRPPDAGSLAAVSSRVQ